MTPVPAIRIQPVGRVSRHVLSAVAKAVRDAYGSRVSIAGRLWRLPPAAFRPGRAQYRGDLLLDWIVERHPNRRPLVAIADADIYEPGYNFLFGLSYLDSGCALVAIARLQEEENTDGPRVAHRAAMIAVHELGHALGLDHCRRRGCVMRYEDHVDAVDRERGRFCRTCRRHLGRSTAS